MILDIWIGRIILEAPNEFDGTINCGTVEVDPERKWGDIVSEIEEKQTTKRKEIEPKIGMFHDFQYMLKW